MRVTGPDLLALDDEVAALEHRTIETCYLCERQQLEATIRPRAKPAPLRKSQVLGQHPITSPMDHFTK
jgi:hypothetical protein